MVSIRVNGHHDLKLNSAHVVYIVRFTFWSHFEHIHANMCLKRAPSLFSGNPGEFRSKQPYIIVIRGGHGGLLAEFEVNMQAVAMVRLDGGCCCCSQQASSSPRPQGSHHGIHSTILASITAYCHIPITLIYKNSVYK